MKELKPLIAYKLIGGISKKESDKIRNEINIAFAKSERVSDALKDLKVHKMGKAAFYGYILGRKIEMNQQAATIGTTISSLFGAFAKMSSENNVKSPSKHKQD